MADINELLKHISKKTLSKEEEIRLGRIIQSPLSTSVEKQEAIDKFIIQNIYLVLKFVHTYKRKEFEFEDFVGYGIVGLHTAATKFDPSIYPNRFASYARHWIKESIMKAIKECSGLPKIPVYLVKNLWSVTRVLANNPDCTDATLAKRANVSESDAKYLRTLIFKCVQFEDTHVETDTTTPEDIYTKEERKNLIAEQMKAVLTTDEFIVIVHTYAFDGFCKRSFAEIEEVFNISNAQKLKISAIKKLKSSDILKKLSEEGHE
jgi:RNA polymerase sigma factor (sigma-70 family)